MANFGIGTLVPLDRGSPRRYLSGVSVQERIESPLLTEPFARWFASRGWTPRAHQLELLAKARAGRSVLLIAPTGRRWWS